MVATVLTVYGIETLFHLTRSAGVIWVATVLTVYGIETIIVVVPRGNLNSCNSTYRLRYWNKRISYVAMVRNLHELQQYLPFTVLKLLIASLTSSIGITVATVLTVYGIETIVYNHKTVYIQKVATVLTVYGIETQSHKPVLPQVCHSCNSTYRLRYWNHS